MAAQLEAIIAALGALPPGRRAEVTAKAHEETARLKFVPNAGPQTAAYYSEADELFFGGEAGGGKSQLVIGVALNCHQRSLILREFKDDARELGARLVEMVGSSDGWNEQMSRWRGKNQTIMFDGLPNEKDKEHHKGKAYDLYAFDELGDFYESQYEFIIAWNRSTDHKQRCRIIATGNPPTRSKGLWVIKRWGAWLDPTHPRPARDRELRWYLRDSDGHDTEVDGPGPYMVDGRETKATSRTFIRSKLSDNPDLARTGYDATLARLPKELRDAYREGKFDAALKDHPFQVIPTSWIRDAMQRWSPRPPEGVPMCAMGVDVAQGGDDNNVLACRYDAWYDKLHVVPGKLTPLGSDHAGLIIAKRRNNCDIVLDMGGGYGGGCYQTLKENDIAVIAYKGSNASMKRTKDGKLKFDNKRAESYWKFREALDPDQAGGSPVALPDDPELVSELTVLTYEADARGIHVMTKEDATKVLGHSPDKADAVIMAWSAGAIIGNAAGTNRAEQRLYHKGNMPKVDLGPRRRSK